MIETIKLGLHDALMKRGLRVYSREWFYAREAAIEVQRASLRKQGFVSSVWVSGNARYPDGTSASPRAMTLLRRLAERSPDYHAVYLSVDGGGKYWYYKGQVNAMLELVREAGPAARIEE